MLEKYVGVYGRENGFTQIWVYDVGTGALDPVPFDEAVFTAYPGVNRRYEATTLQISYTSLVTPAADSTTIRCPTGSRPSGPRSCAT